MESTLHQILKYARKDCYPYIVLPEAIASYLQGPTLPPKPTPPRKPLLPPKPEPPPIPEVPAKVMDKLQAAVASGTAIAGLAGLIILEAPSLLITAGALGVVALAKFAYEAWTYEDRLEYYYTVSLPRYEREKQIYEERLKSREVEVERIKRDYDKKLEQLNREYEEKVKHIKQLWEQGESIPTLTVRQPDAKGNPCIGAYENHLRQWLEEKIKNDSNLHIQLLPQGTALTIKDYSYPYTPDIGILVSKNDHTLFIDVEIDEPWYTHNNQRFPCHALEDERQTRRDNFFKEGGWIVVRFSEDQVADEGNECVNFIYDLIQVILQPTFISLRDWPMNYKRWNASEALTIQRRIAYAEVLDVEL
ncbi:hypothetical protein RYO59_002675 [Thermosynechococcaceae cyanobacterium Okahandja]